MTKPGVIMLIIKNKQYQPRRKTHWLLNNMYNKQNDYVHVSTKKVQTTTITATETECKAVRT